MKSVMLTICVLGLAFSGCSDEPPEETEEPARTWVDVTEMGTLGTQSVSDLSETTVVGDWSDTHGYVLNEDGTVGDSTLTETTVWDVQGNVLILEYSRRFNHELDNGQIERETQTDTWGSTSAIVEGNLYTEVVVRTAGSGDSLDGTWEYYEAKSESYSAGSDTVGYLDDAHVLVTVDGDTLTMVRTESWGSVGNVPPELAQPGSVVEECSGTVTVEAELVTTQMTSGDCDSMDLMRVSDTVLQPAADIGEIEPFTGELEPVQ